MLHRGNAAWTGPTGTAARYTPCDSRAIAVRCHSTPGQAGLLAAQAGLAVHGCIAYCSVGCGVLCARANVRMYVSCASITATFALPHGCRRSPVGAAQVASARAGRARCTCRARDHLAPAHAQDPTRAGESGALRRCDAQLAQRVATQYNVLQRANLLQLTATWCTTIASSRLHSRVRRAHGRPPMAHAAHQPTPCRLHETCRASARPHASCLGGARASVRARASECACIVYCALCVHARAALPRAGDSDCALEVFSGTGSLLAACGDRQLQEPLTSAPRTTGRSRHFERRERRERRRPCRAPRCMRRRHSARRR